jgi:CRISPR-associated protein (TIGR03986 family)
MNRPSHRRGPYGRHSESGERPIPSTGRSAPRAESLLQAIHAPYNFVPLADWVYFPAWSGEASHDLPFSDGFSGTLEFTVIAETPLLVAGEQIGGDKHFVRAPDGLYALPGTTLRGMIRNVLEIATFGKMGLVDDRQPGVRDLSGGLPAYTRAMTERIGSAFSARAETGWLRFEEGVWRIYPCRHSRIEQDDLAALLSPAAAREFKNFVRGRLDDGQRTARAKYRKWAELGGPLDIPFEPGPLQDHPHSRNPLRYSKAGAIGQGSRLGRLVLTGQPSPRKHMEFLFYDTAAKALEPDKNVMRGFLKIHEDSRDWEYWRQRHWQAGEAIPVFYLAQGRTITSLGLAQMFKLPYRLSIHDALRNVSPDHLDRTRLDFVETLFGEAGGPGAGLKSRVAFGTAFCTALRPGEPVTLVLNAPKPTYYPNYIRQATDPGGTRLASRSHGYTTLMDERAEPRGWKRYPAKPFEPPLGVPPSKVSSNLNPLGKGSLFTGKLRIHNLRPEELGALVWALTWNGDRNLVHRIGLARSFGYGQIRIELGRTDLYCNDPSVPTHDPELLLQQCVLVFCADLERACRGKQPGGWRNSRPIRTLLAMADPQAGAGRPLESMVLDHHSRRNDFVEAKKRENYFVLEEYEP